MSDALADMLTELDRRDEIIGTLRSRIADLERQLAEAKKKFRDATVLQTDLVLELAEARKALRAVRNYPGIKEYVGTQITDVIDAAIGKLSPDPSE